MSLKETGKKIYEREEEPSSDGRGEHETIHPHGSGEEPFAPSALEPDLEERKVVWIKAQEEIKAKRTKLVKMIGIALAAAVGIAALIWAVSYFRRSSFSEERVSVALSGPERVASGEIVNFDINYRNLNRASLKDAVLYVSYSENFKPSGNLQFETEGPTVSKYNIGDISGKGEGKVTLRGSFFGPRDALVYVNAKLEYRSSTFNSRFAATDDASVFIDSSPVSLEVSGPQNAASGNAVSYAITYQNSGREAFNDLKIKAEFPEGFKFSNSEPLSAEGDNIWYIGNLAAGQTGGIEINGTIEGARDEEKTLKVFIGEIGADGGFVSYGEAKSTVKIIGSPIVLNQTVNDKKENIFVNAGETAMFKVSYRNTGSIGLRDVILTVEAASPVLDYARLDMRDSKGEFDPEKKIITWKASQVPQFKTLAPGSEGEINFSVPVKDIIPVTGPGDKNFSFSAIARMDSPDIPTPAGANKVVASNAVEVKLNSKLVVAVLGFFNDAEIANSGPLPLKVGEESTFTLHAKISNVSNDATDAKVAFQLAPGTKWKNNFLPRSAAVSFNDRTNELVWNIGGVAAGTGVAGDSKELVFQIGIVPSQNQTGNYALLLNKTIFSAKDSFTGQALEAKLGEKDTNLTEDISVGEMGKVVN